MAGTKGIETRRRIVELAAPVFNRQGYVGASMRDLISATGLEKGGIYNHFGSKEMLALERYELVERMKAVGIAPTEDVFAEIKGELTKAIDSKRAQRAGKPKG